MRIVLVAINVTVIQNGHVFIRIVEFPSRKYEVERCVIIGEFIFMSSLCGVGVCIRTTSPPNYKA